MSDKNNSEVKKPNVRFCNSCLYPSSSAASLEFDEDGVCSGCNVAKEKYEVDWDERKEELSEFEDNIDSNEK